MYTVIQAYNRILEEADKLGSDYFSLPQVLAAFKKEVLDFVGARAKEAELTETVTNDVRPLVVLANIPLIDNPDFPTQKIASIPNNFHTRLTLNVEYTDKHRARKPTVERFGEHNANMVNPNKRPSKQYPLIQQFSDYYNVHTNIPPLDAVQPETLVLMYIKYPTFGEAQAAPVVNLPDTVCELLFSATAAALMNNVGEPRGQVNFQIDQTFRKK